MSDFATILLSADPAEIAPDGSEVRKLLGLEGASIAHYRLAAGSTARALVHRTVDEVWFVLAGRGEIWRRQGEREETVVLERGVCLTIPRGTYFQFRASAAQDLMFIGVTKPPWPGDGEAVMVRGPWPSTTSST